MNEIDKYISGFPKDIQAILEKVRATIKTAAPEAEEVISYKMPAFKQNGMLVFYTAFTGHIGFYPPVPESLKKEAAMYAGPKGNLQFQLDEQIPYDLITRIVTERVKINLGK